MEVVHLQSDMLSCGSSDIRHELLCFDKDFADSPDGGYGSGIVYFSNFARFGYLL